uniref:Uncharacterized protein n=1 Tax=Setaria italica TaxID=4555 RepID=K3YFM9_SETIT
MLQPDLKAYISSILIHTGYHKIETHCSCLISYIC